VHRDVTSAVHDHDGKICMQILHAGRYAYHPFSVAPSAIKVSVSLVTRVWKRDINIQSANLLSCAGAHQSLPAARDDLFGGSGHDRCLRPLCHPG
jgi:2,4-dienoyl-CoA reductase (NADPH2)